MRARGPGCGPSYGSAAVRASTPAEPLADGHFCWKEHVVLRLGRWRLSPWPPFCLRPSRQVLPGASGQWPADLQSSTGPCTCPHVLAPPARKLSASPRPFLSWDPAVLGTRHRRPDCPWPLQHRQAAGRTGLGTAVCVCVSLCLALPRPCVARPGPPCRAWGGLRDLIRLWGWGQSCGCRVCLSDGLDFIHSPFVPPLSPRSAAKPSPLPTAAELTAPAPDGARPGVPGKQPHSVTSGSLPAPDRVVLTGSPPRPWVTRLPPGDRGQAGG